LAWHGRRQRLLIILIICLLSFTSFFLLWDYPKLFLKVPSYTASTFTLRLLKGGAPIGYKLGYLGAVIIVASQFYSIQKRLHPKYTRRLGGRRFWLRIHCLVDVFAIVMVSIHAGFPFSFTYADPFRHIRPLWGVKGWVGVSGLATWFLLATLVSGLYGRYLHSRLDTEMVRWFRSWRLLHIVISTLLYTTGMLHLYISVWLKYISAA